MPWERWWIDCVVARGWSWFLCVVGARGGQLWYLSVERWLRHLSAGDDEGWLSCSWNASNAMRAGLGRLCCSWCAGLVCSGGVGNKGGHCATYRWSCSCDTCQPVTGNNEGLLGIAWRHSNAMERGLGRLVGGWTWRVSTVVVIVGQLWYLLVEL